MAETNIGDCNAAAEILRSADRAANRVALRWRADNDRGDVTYAELKARVMAGAAALLDRGVQEEHRILIALPDSPELIYAFLAAMWAGVVPVLVSSFLAPAEYLFFIKDTRAKVLITTEAMATTLAQSAPADLWPPMLTVGSKQTGSFWEALRGMIAAPAAYRTHPEDAAFWLYSSGTTGLPKGTIHTHGAVGHAVRGYGREVISIGPDDLVFSTSKMFFAYGLGASLYFPLTVGACSVLSPEPFNAARVWKLLDDENPTLLFSVPSVYRVLLDNPHDADRRGLSQVRACVSAGEVLPQQVFDRWRARFGLEIVDGIGSTEMLHIYVSNRPNRCSPGTIGWPVPGYEVMVVDESNVPVADGQSGTMLVRGSSMAAGYWRKRAAAQRAFRGEWYFTGDRALKRPDGAYQILGRSDEMFKVSGQWVSPSEVEEVINGVTGVKEAAVVGCAATDGLIELVAVVVAEEDAGLAPQIAAACGAKLSAHKRPRRIIRVQSLPRSLTGKLQRIRLREIVEAETPEPTGGAQGRS